MSSRRRSLLKRSRPPSEAVEAIEALDGAARSDLAAFEDMEEDEDLEVLEDTLRTSSYGSFDEIGPTMDSGPMEDSQGELPSDGLWLSNPKLQDLFGTGDREAYEPTEPGLPREELLPPLPDRVWKEVEQPPPEVVEAAAVGAPFGAERRATPEELRMVQATPWIAAIAMSLGVAVVGMMVVGLVAFLLRAQPSTRPVELGTQPPLSAPAQDEAPTVETPEVEAAPEEEPTKPGEVEAPAPAAPPAPPEPGEPGEAEAPSDAIWSDAPAEDRAPAAEPDATEPAPEPKRKGLFGKKKKGR